MACALTGLATAGGACGSDEPEPDRNASSESSTATGVDDGVGGAGGAEGCLPPLVICDGECVDIGADERHCGGCGRACGEPGPNETVTCFRGQGDVLSASMCFALCDEGFERNFDTFECE
ncbi:MAG: hypothetical protein AAGA56_17185 [Myxococcota bacterium]